MSENKTNFAETKAKVFIDTLIQVCAVAFLMILSFKVLSPFLPLILWGILLAIMLYPLHQRVAKRLKGKQGKASLILVGCGILLIGIPQIMVGNSMANHLLGWRDAYQNQELSLPTPAPQVKEWPVVGESFYKVWNDAASNFSEFLKDYRVQIEKLAGKVVDVAANILGTSFLLIGALAIAGIMMTWATEGGLATRRILSRIAGPKKGAELQVLIIQTVNSVATGVLGVAFIQTLIFGVGFVLAGIPAAGLLSVAVMVLAVLQLPTIIVAIPVIAFMWMVGDHGVVMNVLFSVCFLVAGLADNILKPLLLGRGCDAPMPIILIGALGGMIGFGLIGLFLGAVLLALGYQIFMTWSHEVEIVDAPKNKVVE